MKRTGPTNTELKELITELKILASKENANIWGRIADDLEKPARKKRKVNIGKISRVTKENEAIIVPGKILGTGSLDHKLSITAWDISKQAFFKLKNSGSKFSTIKEMMKSNPKGKELRIIG